MGIQSKIYYAQIVTPKSYKRECCYVEPDKYAKANTLIFLLACVALTAIYYLYCEQQKEAMEKMNKDVLAIYRERVGEVASDN